MKYIAVKGCKIKLTPPSKPPATIILSAPLDTVKVDSKSCYAGTVTVNVTNYTGGKVKLGANPIPGIINGSAEFTKIDNLSVVLEGDNCKIIVVDPTDSKLTQEVTVEIEGAGQTSTLAE